MYFAKRRLEVGHAYREPGEPVPEASGWPTLPVLVDNHYLEWRDESPAAEVIAAVLERSYPNEKPPSAAAPALVGKPLKKKPHE
jgi:hypothetical protein